MSIRFRCGCGQELVTGADLAGQPVGCPTCHRTLRVPEAAAAAGDKPPGDRRSLLLEALAEDSRRAPTVSHGYQDLAPAAPADGGKTERPNSAGDWRACPNCKHEFQSPSRYAEVLCKICGTPVGPASAQGAPAALRDAKAEVVGRLNLARHRRPIIALWEIVRSPFGAALVADALLTTLGTFLWLIPLVGYCLVMYLYVWQSTLMERENEAFFHGLAFIEAVVPLGLVVFLTWLVTFSFEIAWKRWAGRGACLFVVFLAVLLDPPWPVVIRAYYFLIENDSPLCAAAFTSSWPLAVWAICFNAWLAKRCVGVLEQHESGGVLTLSYKPAAYCLGVFVLVQYVALIAGGLLSAQMLALPQLVRAVPVAMSVGVIAVAVLYVPMGVALAGARETFNPLKVVDKIIQTFPLYVFVLVYWCVFFWGGLALGLFLRAEWSKALAFPPGPLIGLFFFILICGYGFFTGFAMLGTLLRVTPPPRPMLAAWAERIVGRLTK